MAHVFDFALSAFAKRFEKEWMWGPQRVRIRLTKQRESSPTTYRICRITGRFTTRYKCVSGTRYWLPVESGDNAHLLIYIFAETGRIVCRGQGRFQKFSDHGTQRSRLGDRDPKHSVSLGAITGTSQ